MRRATVHAVLALATAGCDALTGPDLPREGAWRRFWDAAADAGVARWPRVCENREIADGAGFGLRIVADGGATWEARGSNSYPQANGRCSRTPEHSRDFGAFLDALSALIGRPYPA